MNEFIVSNNSDLFVTGEIGYDFQAEYFMQQLNSFPKEEVINVHIYSGGGSLFDALAVYDFVKLKGIKFNAYISGLSGSAATIIGAAAEKTYIGANSLYFIHRAISENESLKALGDERIMSIYQNLTGLTKPNLKKLLDNGDNGQFLSSKQAIELGFVGSEFKEEQLAANIDFYKQVNNKINNNMTDENLNELKSGIVAEVMNSVKDFFTKKEKEVSNEALENSVKGEVKSELDKVVNSYESKIKESNEVNEAKELELNAKIEALTNEIAELKGVETIVEANVDPVPENDVKEKELSVGQKMALDMVNSWGDADKRNFKSTK